mmetsp:Transcript_8618/g.14800  ORF Transcript_8618/g.14800 Transcript_8618/m.14800 type:complete len:405 (-) Transcript_8618:1243-2457(-)|eukprot:CAMPEP_0119107560 /NCGR_PEP_ID=MMETSP1180-20130426/11176_1 /TAXON_ID=3052 ORGANISM="Chlamydomonas cf sp, Strain CCMP681" /NCGR_SAMPLE_ID=MMETSP1180 /ASSEMBLY_ACC=CAM_ASM_000741 /LENGTH=404 /DNA_ID=CAMNT_0007093067 /DNA_START=224 /DNA_END=1438 /DNA_ORIENTATION=+
MRSSVPVQPAPLQSTSGATAAATEKMTDLTLSEEGKAGSAGEFFEGKLVDGDLKTGGHILQATSGSGANRQTFNYSTDRVVGNGSFGVVFQATCLETGETVAIKKVLQDKRFKNRELQIMKMVDHPNIVRLKHCFYSHTEKDETYLHLVLEYVPDTVYRISKHYAKNNQRMPNIFVKLYAYQMCRALGWIHRTGICHRDIKPQNLLVNTETHQLKLCDFGSAKVLVKGEPNISYICSRYYRAPELIFGATDYTAAIDVWSVGCVVAELLLGQPLFPGESGVDQLVEIIKVLGTPSREEIHAMNPNYTEFKFPQIKAHPWTKVFSKRMPPDAVDLVSKLLQYAPQKRMTAMQAMTHNFFDELREPGTKLPNGRPLPPLFNWLPGEMDDVPADVVRKLQPKTVASA